MVVVTFNIRRPGCIMVQLVVLSCCMPPLSVCQLMALAFSSFSFSATLSFAFLAIACDATLIGGGRKLHEYHVRDISYNRKSITSFQNQVYTYFSSVHLTDLIDLSR